MDKVTPSRRDSNEPASNAITLRTLRTARWAMIAVTAVLGLMFAELLPGSEELGLNLLVGDINVVAWSVVVGTWSVLNLVASSRVAQLSRSSHSAGVLLAIDAAFLTVLLSLSGHSQNPFTTLYFVPIMLATQVSPRWTWGLAAVCLAGFGSLFLIGGPVPHGHHFSAHLKGMWVAFAVSGVLITVFVHRIAVAINAWRVEVARLRESALRDRQLAQVGSLAAGAAHELGTPLATVTVLVGDLDEMSETERREAIATIKGEVGKCKRIIGAMASSEVRANVLSQDELVPWSAAELASDLEEEVEVIIGIGGDEMLSAPRSAVLAILQELIKNAKTVAETVRLRIESDGATVNLVVEDDGPGMGADVAASVGDPFFTTRGDEGHMGLGLFLAKSQARQLGGALELASEEGSGTRARLGIPTASSRKRS